MNSFIKTITAQTSLSTQEAWWLLEHVTGKKKETLITQGSLSEQEQLSLQSLILKMKDEHMPLAYILGFVPFLDLKIHIKPPILIPRQETEQWVQELIETLKNKPAQNFSILDIGTGSGCIALAIAKQFPLAHITAIDINRSALELARHNSKTNGISNITFIQSDLFASIPSGSRFDLIVSNPPYIDPSMIHSLSKQVKDWEDHAALFADNQGMAIIDKILQQADDFLKPCLNMPFQLVLEIDQYHKDGALSCAQNYDWSATACKDSFGNWRTLWCKKNT
ncbi:MAG: peptide chain release factor N(5)-glutamine methyltransferase [Candidatus Dependentiae bacterium]|nr:peptide chain release factor N(5)-glutamine methyltransferase [Candidatus Dependentiae bacterium]